MKGVTMNQQERISQTRRHMVNSIILNAEGLIAMGLNQTIAAQIACKNKQLYKDEVLFIGQYLNHWHRKVTT
jgi:deoxycytidylate deaminase